MKNKETAQVKRNTVKITENKGVTIIPQDKKILTKNQTRFNNITQRIEKLEKKIIERERRLEFILDYYNQNITPFLESEAKNRIKIAFALDEKINNFKLSKPTRENAGETICQLMNDAFSNIVPTDEEIALYDQYAENTFEEEKESEIEDMKMELEFMFKMQGIDVDLSNLDVENEEEVARFIREMQDKIIDNQKVEEFKQSQENQNQQQKKKTKKEIERETLEKAKEEAQTKSLKSIYISLTKALHPDTATDPLEKAQKEELMKKVTAAYQDKNFPLLLKLELEWVNQTTERLAELGEEKLLVYIEILLDRERELLHQDFMIERNPRFEKIENLTRSTQLSAIKYIDSEVSDFKTNEISFGMILSILNTVKQKNEISEIINDLYYKFVG